MKTTQACRCDNCQWEGEPDELGRALSETPDLNERLDPGSVVPAGECPKCGAFAYYHSVDGIYAVESLREIAKQLEEGRMYIGEVAYHARVCAYEAEGMTRSDAQGVVDLERMQS